MMNGLHVFIQSRSSVKCCRTNWASENHFSNLHDVGCTILLRMSMRDMLKEGISMVKVDVAIMAVVVRAGSTRSTTTACTRPGRSGSLRPCTFTRFLYCFICFVDVIGVLGRRAVSLEAPPRPPPGRPASPAPPRPRRPWWRPGASVASTRDGSSWRRTTSSS